MTCVWENIKPVDAPKMDYKPSQETPCKNCGFADYGESTLTQIGCKLGKLDKFRENEVGVLAAYDEEKEFFVVQGNCNGYRDKGAVERSFTNIEDAVKHVKEQLLLRFGLVVYIDENTSEIDLVKTLKFASQYQHVVFAVNRQLPLTEMQLWIHKSKLPPWTTCKIFEVNATTDRSWYLGSRQLKNCVFATLCRAGDELPVKLVDTISASINDKAMKFVLVGGQTHNTVYTPLLNYTACSSPESPPIVEQIRGYAEKTNEQYLIKNFTDL